MSADGGTADGMSAGGGTADGMSADGVTTQPFVLPVQADADTEAFFAATDAGFLPLHRCRACGRVNGPNELSCSRCRSTDLEQVAAAGGGQVVAATVEHSKPAADGTTHRLVAVIVQLDEGPWWWTQLAGVDPGAVRAGDRVRVELVTPAGGRTVPIVRPSITTSQQLPPGVS